jgi:hypothetical protein
MVMYELRLDEHYRPVIERRQWVVPVVRPELQPVAVDGELAAVR